MGSRFTSTILAAAAATIAAATASKANASGKDYEFQPVAVDVKAGNGAQLAVRLVNKLTGKPVDGAVLFRTRLDMSPESMDEMQAKHAALPSAEPGVYRFNADLTMAGNWAFKVMAKVPGEPETVETTVVFKAKD